MPTASSVLDALHIGNGHAPTLPDSLSPDRLRELAKVATYNERTQERASLVVKTPFTDETVASLPAGSPSDVKEAFRRARIAQKVWATRPYRERARILKRYHDLILERNKEALDLIQLESGKTRYDAFLEVADVALVARYYAYHGAAALAKSHPLGFVPLLTSVEINHAPVGVVGIIAPWNYPLTMAITDAIPALLAGNAVVVKPAEQTPFTALLAAELLFEAGLPRDLLHMIPGDGPTLGPTLIANADYVHFTGSTEVGKLIAQQTSQRLIGCSLELGGKNPFIVLEDADLDKAVGGAMKDCFGSAGQLCVSAERLYVHASLFDDFVERFKFKIEALKIGPGFGWDIDMGSLASDEQLEKVTKHVKDAKSKGATVVVGGHPLPHLGPYFYAPTVLTGVTPQMTLFAEETFGPVVSIYPFYQDDEAVELANSTTYGLNAGVWSASTSRAQAVARRLECGTVNVNECYVASWGSTAAPMGGRKESGLGRRHGPEGILKYTEAQTIATQHLLPIGPIGGMAVEAFAGTILTGLKILRRLPGLR